MRATGKPALASASAACSLLLLASAAAPAANHPATKLPDWSGTWACDDSCFQASEDSFGTDQGRVPLTPKYLALRAQARANRAQQNLSFCLPAGTPGIQQHGVLHEFLFTPDRVTIIFEDGEIRRIYTDHRAHRPLKEMTASFMGDSIGHWEGQTLVVDTIGFPKGSLFQNYGLTATLQTHLVERYHLKDKDHLLVDSVMTDPAIFASPYIYTRGYKRVPITMDEPQCRYGNHDTGESVDLTPPPEDE
ncbi:MAG TPA: hypothetical protein VFG49_15820 [Dyella sp.]|uniref:hypothetical protein n=1 Tax=Dyella sp. TaxID=1869338 RepID=UPI002D79A515|nr:hypothetical protein [Dyella sp.]HET6554995.1 hypothetical protein [Dyella sp.]